MQRGNELFRVADAQHLVGLGPGWDLQLGHAAQNRHFDFVAQRQVGEGQRQITVQVGALASEDVVLAHAHQHVEIARGTAVEPAGALAADAELHPVLDSRGDLDAQQSLGPASPFPAALSAWGAVQLAGAVALGTGLGHRQEAVVASDLAGAAAHVAGFQAAARLDPGPGACLAALEPRDLDLRLQAGGGVLEGDLQLVLQVLAARGPRSAPAAAAGEEVLEDVLEERSEAVEVRALVGVGQDRVRLVHLFEPLLGLFVAAITVGVELHRELAVRLRELGLAGGARDAEDLVVVARQRSQLSSSGAAATDTRAARRTRLCSM